MLTVFLILLNSQLNGVENTGILTVEDKCFLGCVSDSKFLGISLAMCSAQFKNRIGITSSLKSANHFCSLPGKVGILITHTFQSEELADRNPPNGVPWMV